MQIVTTNTRRPNDRLRRVAAFALADAARHILAKQRQLHGGTGSRDISKETLH